MRQELMMGFWDAHCSKQIATPTPHHSNFYRLDALPDAQPTVSEH